MNKKGFTLVELLAIIVLIGVIGLIAIPNISTEISSNDQTKKSMNDKKIENAAKLYVAKYYSKRVIKKTCDIEFTLNDLVTDGLLSVEKDECLGDKIKVDVKVDKPAYYYDGTCYNGTEFAKVLTGVTFKSSCGMVLSAIPFSVVEHSIRQKPKSNSSDASIYYFDKNESVASVENTCRSIDEVTETNFFKSLGGDLRDNPNNIQGYFAAPIGPKWIVDSNTFSGFNYTVATEEEKNLKKARFYNNGEGKVVFAGPYRTYGNVKGYFYNNSDNKISIDKSSSFDGQLNRNTFKVLKCGCKLDENGRSEGATGEIYDVSYDGYIFKNGVLYRYTDGVEVKNIHGGTPTFVFYNDKSACLAGSTTGVYRVCSGGRLSSGSTSNYHGITFKNIPYDSSAETIVEGAWYPNGGWSEAEAIANKNINPNGVNGTETELTAQIKNACDRACYNTYK